SVGLARRDVHGRALSARDAHLRRSAGRASDPGQSTRRNERWGTQHAFASAPRTGTATVGISGGVVAGPGDGRRGGPAHAELPVCQCGGIPRGPGRAAFDSFARPALSRLIGADRAVGPAAGGCPRTARRTLGELVAHDAARRQLAWSEL